LPDKASAVGDLTGQIYTMNQGSGIAQLALPVWSAQVWQRQRILPLGFSSQIEVVGCIT